MSGLPRLVQRAPSLLYGASILYFVGTIVLSHLQMANAYGSTNEAFETYRGLATLGIWLQAAQGAIYIAANGVIAHILLAIWGKDRDRDREGPE